MITLKTLGLAAIAVVAMTAILGAGTASATVLCTGTPAAGTHCATKEAAAQNLDFSTTTSMQKKVGSTVVETCSMGTMSGAVATAGSTGEAVKVNVTALTWTGCTTTVDTLSKGTLEFRHELGTDNATVTSSGMEVTTQFLGVSCIFKTNNTQIGTLTGGNAATIDINGTIPQSGGGFLCPSSGVWSGTYTLTSPTATVHVAAG